MTYRERLGCRGTRPAVIERTEKQPGDRVLASWSLPVEVVR